MLFQRTCHFKIVRCYRTRKKQRKKNTGYEAVRKKTEKIPYSAVVAVKYLLSRLASTLKSSLSYQNMKPMVNVNLFA